jgi:hypothetical protein
MAKNRPAPSCDHSAKLPHSKPTHDDHHNHDHQPSKKLMKNSSQESAEVLIPINVGQNNDYSAGYSIDSLQGRKQKIIPNRETISEFY